MPKPELVLSNTTSFFIGGLPALFRNAKKYGFKYVEIVPYRWTTSQQILALEKKYGVMIAGIHLPDAWKSYLSAVPHEPTLFGKLAKIAFHFYLGNAIQSQGWQIAKALAPRRPYLIFHTNMVTEMGPKFSEISKNFYTVIENIPYQDNPKEFFWNPVKIREELKEQNISGGLVFDPGHFNQTRKKLPQLNLLEIYKQAAPEVIHISYNSRGIHTLPNRKEQQELIAMLKIHPPKYITLETNPWVSVKKGKKLLERIIQKSTPSQSPPKDSSVFPSPLEGEGAPTRVGADEGSRFDLSRPSTSSGHPPHAWGGREIR